MRLAVASLLVVAFAYSGSTYPAPAFAAKTETGPPTVSDDDIVFQPRTLRYGSAERAGLVPEHLSAMRADLERFMRADPPMYAGAVVLAARDGVILARGRWARAAVRVVRRRDRRGGRAAAG